MSLIDLDDTSACPRADACEGCGSVHNLLVCTAGTMVGVHCMTLCAACRVRGSSLKMSAVRAVTRALDHCAHLGIDADQMGAAMLGDGQ